MRNLKLQIEKTLKKIPAERMVLRHAEHAKDVTYINNGITPAIMFRDIQTDEAHTSLVATLGEGKYPDLTRLPFDDFIIHSYIGTSGAALKNRGYSDIWALSRFTKSVVDPNMVIITTYLQRSGDRTFGTLCCTAICTRTYDYEVLAYDKQLERLIKNPESEESKVELVLAQAYLALTAVLSYESEKIENTLSFSERKRVARDRKEEYIEYTLDLTKSRKVKFKKPHQGGTHASPAEHVRRGHERVYKSGKTVWVRGTIVNEGSARVIEKDYSLNAK